MDNDDQIQQEQDRDYKMAACELNNQINILEAFGVYLSTERSESLHRKICDVRDLIKVLGVNL